MHAPTLPVHWAFACNSKIVWTLFSSRFYQREAFKCLCERDQLFICYHHVLLKLLLKDEGKTEGDTEICILATGIRLYTTGSSEKKFGLLLPLHESVGFQWGIKYWCLHVSHLFSLLPQKNSLVFPFPNSSPHFLSNAALFLHSQM